MHPSVTQGPLSVQTGNINEKKLFRARSFLFHLAENNAFLPQGIDIDRRSNRRYHHQNIAEQLGDHAADHPAIIRGYCRNISTTGCNAEFSSARIRTDAVGR